MRKSERLRLLELQMVRLEMNLDMYSQVLSNLLESQGMPDLDAGKWYKPKKDQE